MLGTMSGRPIRTYTRTTITVTAASRFRRMAIKTWRTMAALLLCRDTAWFGSRMAPQIGSDGTPTCPEPGHLPRDLAMRGLRRIPGDGCHTIMVRGSMYQPVDGSGVQATLFLAVEWSKIGRIQHLW